MKAREITAALRAARRARDMSQSELCQRGCLSITAIGRWERNECDPQLSMVVAWAETLGYRLELVKAEPGREAE